MSARSYLREATAAEHERVDALFSRFDLTDRQGYALFLRAQAAAYLPAEAALEEVGAGTVVPDWPERRRSALLTADLADLSIAPPRVSAAECRLDDKAALLGALYVLEGSRLGGAYLKRQVPPDWPQRFLGAPQPPGAWRGLLILLDNLLAGHDERRAAAEAARGVFKQFEAAALAELRTQGE